MGRLLIFLAFLSVPLSAHVLLDVTPYDIRSAPDWDEFRSHLEDSILDGDWDKRNLQFAVRGKRFKVEVNSDTFADLPQAARRGVIDYLTSFYAPDQISSFRVTVNTKRNHLELEPVLQTLEIPLESLPEVVPAETLLSDYASRWAYQLSLRDGANCWHTSISSIFPGWFISRRMPPEEFACQVSHSFQPIKAPSQWGDLIRLTSGGEEVHGFTFLGYDRSDPNRMIVFTKNGYSRGYFHFSDFETVTQQVYPGNQVSYFRPTKIALDPWVNPSSPCSRKRHGAEGSVDGIIEAGLKRAGTKPPLDWTE